MSFTSPAKRSASSSPSQCPYSLSAEPQPAAFVTTMSTSRPRVAMRLRAMARNSSRRPAWRCSAPQQPCARGTTTSQPAAESNRAVARLISGKKKRWTQPVRRAARARALPVELGAGRLEELSEGHPGGTCRLAGATAETEVEMARQPRRQLGPALGGRAHQIDAAARRIHLLPQHAIRRALGKADATV